MAGTLTPVLGLFAHPKRAIQVDEDALVYLTPKTAHILFAVAEAVVGADFHSRTPHFIPTIDDYLAYQRRESRDALTQGLLLVENTLVSLLFARRFRGFSHLSIADRQRVLSHLKESNRQIFRNLYAAFVNISASTFYAGQMTWREIQYDGVSVDDPRILSTPRWRPGDPRPVKP